MEDWGPIYKDRHMRQVSFGVRWGVRQRPYDHWKTERAEFLVDTVEGPPSPQETAEPNPGDVSPQPGPWN